MPCLAVVRVRRPGHATLTLPIPLLLLWLLLAPLWLLILLAVAVAATVRGVSPWRAAGSLCRVVGATRGLRVEVHQGPGTVLVAVH